MACVSLVAMIRWGRFAGAYALMAGVALALIWARGTPLLHTQPRRYLDEFVLDDGSAHIFSLAGGLGFGLIVVALSRWTVQRFAWAQRWSATAQSLAHTGARWQRASDGGAQRRVARLDVLADRLAQLDPQRVLSRGYALIETESARVVVAPSQLRVGQRLRVSQARGAADVVPGSVQERLPEGD